MAHISFDYRVVFAHISGQANAPNERASNAATTDGTDKTI